MMFYSVVMTSRVKCLLQGAVFICRNLRELGISIHYYRNIGHYIKGMLDRYSFLKEYWEFLPYFAY